MTTGEQHIDKDRSNRQRAVQASWVSLGLCRTGCGRPLYTAIRCAVCAEKLRQEKRGGIKKEKSASDLRRDERRASVRALGNKQLNDLPGWVYLVTNEVFPGWCKIGMEVNEGKRDYQTGDPYRRYIRQGGYWSPDREWSESEVREKLEIAGYERGTPSAKGKSEWFRVPIEVGLAYIKTQCHHDEILLAKEEVEDAADDSKKGFETRCTGFGPSVKVAPTVDSAQQSVYGGRLIPLEQAIESESAAGTEADDVGGGDSGC